MAENFEKREENSIPENNSLDSLEGVPGKRTIKIVCQWCGKDMGTKEIIDIKDLEGLSASHSICSDCKKEFEELPDMPKSKEKPE